MEKRIDSGIEGLDVLINGGLLKNRVYLVQGDAGTGKSTFAMQFLVKGANEGQPGVLFSMEYEPQDIITDMSNFGWDIRKLVNQNKIRIISPPGGFETPKKMDISSLIDYIFDAINEIKAKRLVIDSLNSLEISLYNELNRNQLIQFITLIRDLDCTTLVVSEKHKEHGNLMFSYMTHGIIQMYNLQRGASRLRAVEIIKMRGTNHSNLIHSMSIDSNKGIEILPHEIDLGI